MPQLETIVDGLGPSPYTTGSTSVVAENYFLTIKYNGSLQLLDSARNNLDNFGNTQISPTSIVLKEKLGLDEISYHYAIIHPTTLRESVANLKIGINAITEEFVYHARQQAAQRISQAISGNQSIEPPKLSDFLAYCSDVVFSTAVFIKDAQGRVLLQQRAAKSTSFPLHWQPTANGKLENYQEALQREIGEEAGEKVKSLNLSLTLINETAYLLRKKGVEKPAIGRDYEALIGDLDIMPLLKISPETEKFEFVTRHDLDSGRIIPLSLAKKVNATPQSHIIMFDDQYQSLLKIFNVASTKITTTKY